MPPKKKGNDESPADRMDRIAIVSADRCRPKKCRQECKKSCPVVKVGAFREKKRTTSVEDTRLDCSRRDEGFVRGASRDARRNEAVRRQLATPGFS